MKKWCLLLSTLLIGSFASGQSDKPCVPCLPDGIMFETQAEIDSFPIDYPNCTEIGGNVMIHGDDITNLNGLAGLTTLSKDLYITSNPLLNYLTGLDGVTVVGHTLLIGGNDSLKDITGLRNLVSVGYSVEIQHNPSLLSLSGLEGLDTIQGFLTISRNPFIQNLSGLDELSYVGGSIYIAGDDNLLDLSGLQNLSKVGGSFDIHGNPILANLFVLKNLKSIGYSLSIFDDDSLTDLHGLESLNNIGFYIGISSDSSIMNLNGLENLQQVWSIIIRGNPQLNDIEALENVDADSIIEIDILENKSLSACAIPSICKYLESPNGNDKIYDNTVGCNSIQEIKDSCTVFINETSQYNGFLLLYPNPAFNTITIESPAKGSISICSTSGQQLLQQEITEPTTTIDVSNLPSGIYVVKVVGEKGVQVGKFVK